MPCGSPGWRAAEPQGAHQVRVVGCELPGQAAVRGRAVDVGPVDTEVVEHRDHGQGGELGAVGLVGLLALPRAAGIEGEGVAERVEVVACPVPSMVVVRLTRQQDQRCPTRPQDPGSRELHRPARPSCRSGDVTKG